ncbi:flagellar motor protein MotB [Flavobacterium sp. K5-23]|uniref:flagellar motor protein MotB n=1 Tax=Flavobacterium sp. K5-23 TaxID=2746225 RepID=UPI0020100910|nr:flagellar motor protein MotB [Flavobacterium sp. K5-23]UQD57115.1 flagellar motor protein MotB [Flavobacterium sp. K5-23]
MKNKILLFILISSAFSIKIYSQKEKNNIVVITTTKYAKIDVIKTYERVAEKGYKSIDMFKQIGDSHYSNFDFEKAARWYCELFAMTSNLEPKYYYQYAQSLKSIGEHDKANEIMGKFNLRSEAIADKNIRK